MVFRRSFGRIFRGKGLEIKEERRTATTRRDEAIDQTIKTRKKGGWEKYLGGKAQPCRGLGWTQFAGFRVPFSVFRH